MSKRVTLSDVAKEAGVSVQTASHVLSKNMTVRLPASTRQRVTDAAERVGYRPNRLAQAMKAGKTQLVGAWIPLERPILNYMRALIEINKCAGAAGYDLMIAGLGGQMAFSGEGKPPFNWPLDGLIAYDAGKAAGRFREDPQNDAIPLAVIGLEEYKNSDSVAWSAYETYRRLTESVIAQGRRKIVHVTPRWVYEQYPREQRRRGYREAMTEAGLEPTIVISETETFANAKRAFAEHLDKEKPDAVMAFTDTLALGAASELLDRGCSIPGDCAVWGYGDYPESELFSVPISTIRVPVEQTVATAWSFLESRMKNPGIAPRLEILPMDVVQRQSS